jgi:hypothetical protein
MPYEAWLGRVSRGWRMSADEGLQVEGMRVESNGRKRGRINNGGEGLLWQTLEVDSLFKRSAKAVREARITQTGCIHFPMQDCRWIFYYNKE